MPQKFRNTPKPAFKKGEWIVSLEFILKFYDCYMRERHLRKAAAALEVSLATINKLVAECDEIKLAREMADHFRHQSNLAKYVMRNLSPEARKTWEELQTKTTAEEVEELFKCHPVKLRQQLFCHALLSSCYDVSDSCRMVGINRNVIEMWRHDLDFLQMLEEVRFHKKNFFENALLGLVAESHPGAVIFANRTINADRGYSEKLEVTNRTEEISASDFDISDLDLDLETQRKILKAIEKKKRERQQDNEQDENDPAPGKAMAFLEI